MKIVIIEDEFFVAEQIADLVSQLGFEVIGVYHSGEDFQRETKWDFQAAIIDIFLSGSMTGLDLGRQISDRKIPFIFLTANRDERTLLAAARLKPKGYITKPFQRFDVAAALEMIKIEQQETVKIRTNSGVQEILPKDIYYIKGDAGYLEIYSRFGKTVQRKLLKELIDELPETDFVRVHRSYIINKQYLQGKSSKEIIVNGTKIPISRGYKDALG